MIYYLCQDILNEGGLGPDLAVMMTCVFTAGGAVGKFVGGHFSDLVGERKVMSYGFFLTAPLFFAVPFLPLSWAILALALAGLIIPTVLPAIITTISKEIDLSRTGIAFELLMFVGFGFGSISFIADTSFTHAFFTYKSVLLPCGK